MDGDVAAGLLPESITLDADSFRKEMALRPYEYLAREPILLSTMPHWQRDGRLQPAPLGLRLFVAATRQGYRLMPGGLARVAAGDGILSKDVWVMGSKESPEPRVAPTKSATGHGEPAKAIETRSEPNPATDGDRR